MSSKKESNNTGISSPATRRIVSADPGLMSAKELLAAHKGGRRRTLEQLIAQNGLTKRETNAKRFLHKTKEKVRWFLDHAQLNITYDDFMMIVTIFVLFGDDIRLLSLPPSADKTFQILNSIAFFLFLLEMTLHCWAKSDFSKGIFRVKGYMFSFFFWLDLLAVLSMIPDINWLASALGLSFLPGSNLGTKAGKASKIGAKSGRVVRMARLVRLVKLYKITSQRMREKKIEQDLVKLVDLGHINHGEVQGYLEKLNAQKQSKVGAELSDIITRRVIIAVLLMLCVVPLLSYSSPIQDEKEATQFLHKVNIQAGYGESLNCDFLLGSTNEYKDFMSNIANEISEKKNQYLIGLKLTPERCNSDQAVNFMNNTLIGSIREESIASVQSTPTVVNGIEYSVLSVFNLRSIIEEESLSGIYLTLFVIFMLILLSTQFNGDAQRLVLSPIEDMMDMVNMVAEDPLDDFDFHAHSKTGEYETRVIQVAIQKITALLRVGFGVAGAEIISTNMAVEGEHTAMFEPMLPGKRIYAIFGFCDIHSFDLCTEKLEDEIMTFINSVARIVHEEVTRWGGMCNKNLGNAFLMVWRIGDEAMLQNFSGRRRRSERSNSFVASSPARPVRSLSVDLRRIPDLDIISDKALIGFLKVVVEVNRDGQLLAYRNDERLRQNSIDFMLRMGFGLHAGWAIEGAVGSLQKIDATYLSPHVNMAARMEAASRQFGVAILMTEKFVELMSLEAQEHCRKLDVVTVKGSEVPMTIYTYDTFQNQTFPQLQAPKFSDLDLNEVLVQQAEDYDTYMWEHDQDLIQLRRLSTPAFRKVFKQGINNYLGGNWTQARECLENADKMMSESDTGGDGPSQTILNYMRNRDWKCPSDWKGYRPLTSK